MILLQFNDMAARVREREDALRRSEERRRASLCEKDALLKEIHHRVKNNFQVISSLLNPQTAQIDRPDLRTCLQQSGNRIASMAPMHERVYQAANLLEVNVGGHLRRIVEQLCHTYQGVKRLPNVEITADGFAVLIDTAVPLGLPANELISNAFEHAFPNGESGNVWISLRSEFADIEKQGWYVIVIADDGIGLPSKFEAQASDSLGLELVRALARQLGGKLWVKNDRGARFEVRFPHLEAETGENTEVI